MCSLSSVRKKRKPASGYVNAESVKGYTQKSHVPSLHSTKPAGIAALDLAADGKKVVTGGADKAVQIFDLEASKVLGTLKGHTKAVTNVVFVPEANVAISSSADKTVRVWGEDGGKWSAKSTITGHKGEVTGLAVHPSGGFVASASADSTWSIHDIETASTVATYKATADEGSFAYSSFSIHPDGILHGGGTQDGTIRVWDARQSTSLAASLDSQSSNAITSLSFSENGYYLATSSSAAPTVSIFDLRKLSVISSWSLPSENTINEVRFDTSAQFLTVAGTDLRVYANKTWEELLKFDDNAGLLTGARWGPLGKEIVLSGMDRTLRILGAAA
jgi:pre-mRNA-processing factor 19